MTVAGKDFVVAVFAFERIVAAVAGDEIVAFAAPD